MNQDQPLKATVLELTIQVPIPTVPNYCATKAALHSFILTLRSQLQDTAVKVIELFPPAVQTELHGEGGKDFGMPLRDFTDEVCLQRTNLDSTSD